MENRQATGPHVSLVPRETFVIVGAGQAGAQAALTLRELGFKGRLVVLGAEAHPPYQRPPLSKALLGDGFGLAQVALRPARAYADLDIELKLGITVDGIDVAASHVLLANHLRLGYDKLLLATGSRPRALDVPGAGGPGVHVLRTLEDALALREALGSARRLAIVGGGYLGLEVAAAAAAAGAAVHVLERESRLMARTASAEVAAFFLAAHRSHHVDVRCDCRVTSFEGTDRLESIVTDDGRVAAELAVVSVGARPNSELAHEAGLACDDGIVVDAMCRTSAANIYAAGDCARFPDAMTATAVRRESVQNAVDQAACAAHNMMGGAQAYRKVPWYWSRQYGLRLQSAGTLGGDEVQVKGDRERGRFALLYRAGGRLRGVEAVNLPGEYLAAQRDIAREVEAPSGTPRGARAA